MAKSPRPFDHWTTYNGHSGIDYPYSSWTPILASDNGVVSSHHYSDRGGYYRYVQQDDGKLMGYFHMPDFSGPGDGTRVSRGTVVGYVGSTGNSTGPHLHNECTVNGGLKPPPSYWDFIDQAAGGFVGGAPPQPGPTQRLTGPEPVNRRIGSPSTSAPTGEPLPPNTIANFDGWIYGESVDGNNVWFNGGFSDDWFWSGGFTDTGTHDLADLNPTTPPSPKARVVLASAPANRRMEPTTASPVVGTWPANTVCNMDGWIRGESVQGNDVWFREGSLQQFSWSGGFTDTGTHDLPELSGTAPNPPYTFDAFSPVVTEVKPAAIGNFEDGANGVRFPLEQFDVVLHDFGTDGQDTYSGTVAWFQNPDADASAHFVVSGAHITQMVSLADRAYHAGADGNWFVGIELDPAVGREPGDAFRDETVASANRLLDALREHYDVAEFEYHHHSEFMSTSCGDDVHFEDYPQDDEEPTPPADIDYARIAKEVNDEAAVRRQGWT